MHIPAPLLLLVALAACQPQSDRGTVPGDSADSRPFSSIGADETLRFTGTEPFWGGEVRGASMVYRTPDDDDGRSIAIRRFAGRGGLSISGRLDGHDLDLMITEGECSDGMSDRRFPFEATLRIGKDIRSGCAWTDGRPYAEPSAATEARAPGAQ